MNGPGFLVDTRVTTLEAEKIAIQVSSLNRCDLLRYTKLERHGSVFIANISPSQKPLDKDFQVELKNNAVDEPFFNWKVFLKTSNELLGEGVAELINDILENVRKTPASTLIIEASTYQSINMTVEGFLTWLTYWISVFSLNKAKKWNLTNVSISSIDDITLKNLKQKFFFDKDILISDSNEKTYKILQLFYNPQDYSNFSSWVKQLVDELTPAWNIPNQSWHRPILSEKLLASSSAIPPTNYQSPQAISVEIISQMPGANECFQATATLWSINGKLVVITVSHVFVKIYKDQRKRTIALQGVDDVFIRVQYEDLNKFSKPIGLTKAFLLDQAYDSIFQNTFTSDLAIWSVKESDINEDDSRLQKLVDALHKNPLSLKDLHNEDFEFGDEFLAYGFITDKETVMLALKPIFLQYHQEFIEI